MAYPPRVTAPGSLYHVTARGNNRQAVFRTPDDYDAFLRIVLYAKRQQPFHLFGYCLMTNHIHLCLRPAQTSTLSKILHLVLRTYAAHYNQRHQRRDHLWRTRFWSRVIHDERYAFCVLAYIDANPVRAGICQQAQQYPWSSARAHLLGARDPCLDAHPQLLQDQERRLYGAFVEATASDDTYPQEVVDTSCGKGGGDG